MALTFSALEHDLRRRVDGEVRFDAGSRGAYSTDASNYRQVPAGVVVPRTVEAGAETVAVCAGHGVPVVSRGGGTSLAGQACNAAVVIDWSTADASSTDVWVRFQPRCRKCHRRYDGALGEGSPRAKLTAGNVRRLRARRADGLTYQQLADEFGISDVSAHAAVNRRTWAHVA